MTELPDGINFGIPAEITPEIGPVNFPEIHSEICCKVFSRVPLVISSDILARITPKTPSQGRI